jgi:hypothetical protein
MSSLTLLTTSSVARIKQKESPVMFELLRTMTGQVKYKPAVMTGGTK